MKNFIIVSLVMLSWELSAQVIITQSNFPAPGTTINRNIHRTAMEFDPGVPGPGNVWNYGGLNSDTIVTYIFLNPNSTPYVSDYPNSTLSLEMAPDLFAYIKVDNVSAEELGFAGDAGSMGLSGVNIKFKYNLPLTIMNFPSQFGSTFVDSAFGEIRLPASAVGITQPGIDSVGIKRYIKRTGNFDATGSLTVNTENWQNALRYKNFEETTDSFFVKFFGTWTDASQLGAQPQSSTNLAYQWFVNGHSYPVLDARMNAIGDSAVSVEFYAPGTSKSKKSSSILNIYPNPASNIIYFNGDFTNVQNILIFNTLGQKQEVQAVIKNQQAEVLLNGLANGIYIYQIIDKNSNIVSTGKFVVEK